MARAPQPCKIYPYGAPTERPFASGGGSARGIETTRDAHNGPDPFHSDEFRAPRVHWFEAVVFTVFLCGMSVFIVRAAFALVAQLGLAGGVVAIPFLAFLVEGWLQAVDRVRDPWALQALRLTADDGVTAHVRLPHTPMHAVLAMIAIPGAMGLMFVWGISLGLFMKAVGTTGKLNAGSFAIPIVLILALLMLLAIMQRMRRLRGGYYDLAIDRQARTIVVPRVAGGPRSLAAGSVAVIRTESRVSGTRSRTRYSAVQLDLCVGGSIRLCEFRDHEAAADGLAKWIGIQLAIPIRTETPHGACRRTTP